MSSLKEPLNGSKQKMYVGLYSIFRINFKLKLKKFCAHQNPQIFKTT
jgi:hypothetical protein